MNYNDYFQVEMNYNYCNMKLSKRSNWFTLL